jgi:GxxExxY protein
MAGGTGSRARSGQPRILRMEETTDNTNIANKNPVAPFVSFVVAIKSLAHKGGTMEETTDTTNILYEKECFKINHAIYTVHNKLGSGFLESVYHEALEIELGKENIPFESQKKIQIYYDDKPLTQFYKADIICFDKILIELKAVSKITNEHKAQLINYLAATKLRLGLLVNFGTHPKVEICRIIH